MIGNKAIRLGRHTWKEACIKYWDLLEKYKTLNFYSTTFLYKRDIVMMIGRYTLQGIIININAKKKILEEMIKSVLDEIYVVKIIEAMDDVKYMLLPKMIKVYDGGKMRNVFKIAEKSEVWKIINENGVDVIAIGKDGGLFVSDVATIHRLSREEKEEIEEKIKRYIEGVILC